MSDEWNHIEQGNPATSSTFDIELLKNEVGQRFPFYDLKFNTNTAMFFCRIDEETLEINFESLRVTLSEKGYIPMLRYEQGEHRIYVIQKPKIKKKPVWINLILLIATVFTTTLAGSLQWVLIYNVEWINMISPVYLLDGFLFFSFPLLSILGIHEMGHYYISKKHKLETSLPYFIPLPPPFTLGTFGAVISTKEPIPDRKSLLDVGVSGPIFGFFIAIIVSFVGFYLMQQHPIIGLSENIISLTFPAAPLLFQGISNFFTIPQNAIIHPTLFAGWVGLFLTAVNLLPIGQLDGGHISRALFKEKSKYFSWVVIILLLALGLFNNSWLIFTFLVLFLIGTQHQPPLNEITPLDTKRKIIGVIALLVFIVCFAPIPF